MIPWMFCWLDPSSQGNEPTLAALVCEPWPALARRPLKSADAEAFADATS